MTRPTTTPSFTTTVVRPSGARHSLLVATMCACVVLVVGMVAAINLAVPMLAESTLHPSATSLIWIVDLYVIFFACLVIPGGAAGDRFGRKGVLITGLVVFAIGAGVSASSTTVAMILVGRALSGIGAAAVLPNTLALLLVSVAADRHGPVIATWASMTGVGGVIGNAGGGLILATGCWRWLFIAVIPASSFLAVLVARTTPVSARHDHKLDPAGVVLFIAGSLALLLGIVQGPVSGWYSPVVIAGFTSSVALFSAWTLVELHVEQPLLDPRLLQRADLRSACLGMLTVFFGMFALFYVNASFLQYAKGFGVLRTGIGIIPLTLPIVLGGRHVARVVRRISVTPALAIAFAFIGSGLLGLSTCGAATPYAGYAGWLIVMGIGVTLALPTLSAAIAGSLPPSQAGVGAGLQATTRELGSALGVAIIGTVLTARFTAALPSALTAGQHPHTVAEALAGTQGGQTDAVLAAFVSSAGIAMRVIGVTVFVLGSLVLIESAVARHRLNRASPRWALGDDDGDPNRPPRSPSCTRHDLPR